jgi:hypothetical protein
MKARHAALCVGVGALAAGPIVVTEAEPASAQTCFRNTVQVQRDAYLMVGSGCAVTVIRGDIDHWNGFRISEARNSWKPDLSPSICDYQAMLVWQSPDQSHIYAKQESSFHRGCSSAAWMDYPNWAENYKVKTRFPTKWHSNHTGSGSYWYPIGTLVHSQANG